MVIKIIIADRDEAYLSSLSANMMKKREQFEIYTFSRKDSFLRFLKSGESANIVLAEPYFVCEELTESQIQMKLLLAEGTETAEGYKGIRKYQKTEDFIQSILLSYAETTGKPEVIKGHSNTKIAAFYSPAGGSGKTVLALAAAAACAVAGKKVIYLNLESIDSTSGLFQPCHPTMSDVFLALKTTGMSVDVKLLNGCKRDASGICYITPAESIADYLAVGAEEIKKMLQAFEAIAEYDAVILDLASEFHEQKISVLEACDLIFVPLNPSCFSSKRLAALCAEDKLHDSYRSILQKMRIIINDKGEGERNPDRFMDNLPIMLPVVCEVGPSPLLAEPDKIIRSGAVMLSLLKPVVDAIDQLP